MKTKTSLLIIYLAGTGLVSSSTFAQDNPPQENAVPEAFAEESEPPVKDSKLIVPEEFISEPAYSNIELGIGYVPDDAYFFGRYNGLQTEGAYLVGDIDAEKFSDDGRFWNIRGTNLGLESRYLRLEGGKQGSHKFFLEWDELPNYRNNTGQTPFDGVGTDNLSLPSGYTGTGDLDTYLHGFELQTKRERIKAGASFVAKQRWLFDIDFSHENKQGVDAIGGAILNNTNNTVRNTNTSLLPEPIDQDTDLVNATLSYAGEDGQADLTYHASFFNNTYASLSWQDPFNPATGEGSMALAPDNEFHQLSLTGGYSLPYRSRLTGVASMGRMTQNQKFQPYSVTSGVPANESLDGEVWVLNGQLKLSSRPITKLRLNAGLTYDERDNQTPVQNYTYYVMDSTLARSATNNPYSYKNNRFNLDANYRFNAIVSLRGGYKYNAMERSNFDAGREDTDENTLFAKLKLKPHSTIDLELYGEASSRDGSDIIFDSGSYQDPLMRKYNLADRDRTKLGALINYMATEKLYLGARADYSEDDYTDTEIGLTEASQPTVTVDFSYTPVDNLTTYGYYTWESIQSSQNGNDVTQTGGGPSGGATPTTGPWQADFDDTFDTVGVGAKWTDLGKWDLGADLLFSKAVGHIDMTHMGSTVPDQYPDNLTEMYSIKLWTDYNYSKQLVYKFGYWYEEYLADNWAVDGLEPYDPTVVANTLLLGNTTMDYEVRVFTVSAIYKFQ